MDITGYQLMELGVDALFTHDADGSIRRINEPEGELAPRFFFGHTAEGSLWRFRYDLHPDTRRKLAALAAAEPGWPDLQSEPHNLEAFLAVLREEEEVQSIYCGPAYRFPDDVPMPVNVTTITRSNLHVLRHMVADVDDVARHFEAGQPTVAVLEENLAVSVCFSSRLTEHVAIAGVETLEPYRGRGYATAVVAGWARAVRAMGRIPLYGTTWDNRASQGVARKLGLIRYGTELSLT